MKRVYLVGSTARFIRRLARWDGGITLVASDVQAITTPDRGRVTLDALGLNELMRSLGCGVRRDVELVVGSTGERIRAKGIRCHLCSRPLPRDSFELLVGSEAMPVPSEIEVLVQAPAFAFLDAASSLSKLVSRGSMSKTEALLRLAKLGIEDCSTYVLHPAKPLAYDCKYQVDPILSAEKLRDYLKCAKGFAGLKLARDAGKLVFDNSASQMETFLNAGISFPSSLGCMGLQQPLANHRLQLSSLQKLMLNHVDHITPDLLWEDLLILMEYLGQKPHKGERAENEDMGRFQDYGTLGFRTFPVRYRHVCSPQAFNRLMVRLAKAMDECGARGSLATVNELQRDESFLAQQKVFFKVMLPAVRDR